MEKNEFLEWEDPINGRKGDSGEISSSSYS